MTEEQSQRWDLRYSEPSEVVIDACYVLKQHQCLLPNASMEASKSVSTETRTALDLACGLGGNALFLAGLGFDTYAWDISSVALSQLQAHAQQRGLRIHTDTRDVESSPPEEALFDVIVVSRFLDRAIIPALIDALRNDGLIFYQTFTEHARSGPTNHKYLLKDNELLQLFSPLRIRAFEDAALCGQADHGFRDESYVVAHKRDV